MISKIANYKTIYSLTGHIFFLFLLLIAHLFYMERMINSDSAYYSMELLYHEDYIFPHSRYINLISQTIPILVLKAGVSLNNFLWIYSLTFIGIYYLCFLWVNYGLKNKAGVFFMVMAMCIGFRYKVYVGVTETTFSFFFLTVFIAWWTSFVKQKNHWYKWPLTILLLLIVVSGHPIMLIPFFIFVIYDTIFHHKYLDKDQILLFISGLLAYGLRMVFVNNNGYEKGKMGMLKNPLEIKIWDYPVFDIFVHYCTSELLLPLIAFLFISIYWLKRKKGLAQLFLIFSSLIFMMLILLTMRSLNHDIRNMIDGYFGVWCIVVALPIYYQFKYETVNLKILLMAFILIIFGSVSIWNKHHFFETRIAYLEKLIEANTSKENTKALVKLDGQNFPFHNLWYNWGIGLETLLLSTVKDAEQSRTVYVYTTENEQKAGGKNKLICSPWNVHEFKLENLNKKHFKIDESAYKEVKYNWHEIHK